MLPINAILVQGAMRRSLVGADAADPVLPDRSRPARRRRRARATAAERGRFPRPRAAASRSS